MRLLEVGFFDFLKRPDIDFVRFATALLMANYQAALLKLTKSFHGFVAPTAQEMAGFINCAVDKDALLLVTPAVIHGQAYP